MDYGSANGNVLRRMVKRRVSESIGFVHDLETSFVPRCRSALSVLSGSHVAPSEWRYLLW